MPSESRPIHRSKINTVETMLRIKTQPPVSPLFLKLSEEAMSGNRLIYEKSPYLLQHAYNPVDWFPWKEEAFNISKAHNKPIFLSIGYATCHWCHVMEKESFEDEEAAKYLNDTFICIKVDREERPDIDAVYMAACQMLTGRGGWPLTIFMTPDKEPFFAATYIPKHNRYGQVGLIEICRQVKDLWVNQKKKVLDSSMQISKHLNSAFSFTRSDTADESILHHAYDQLEKSFDTEYGGFGPAPKFPTPHRLLFLLRYYQRTGRQQALEMVKRTLTAMRLGGIWDHVGFGLHRYSTDARWLLPHFEKMLYDQALTAMAFLETFQITREAFFSRTAEELFSYILRDMTSEGGAFFAAEDADSEGEEGKFYVWFIKEFKEVLGEEKGKLWQHFLNMDPEGNYYDEATREKTGANILYLSMTFDQWAQKLEIGVQDLMERWEMARETLFQIRKHRVPPLKDDKILTDWNGLMIGAMAMAARILGKPGYAVAARKAAAFILSHMTTGTGRLLHRYRDGEAGIDANANDYSFLIFGLLELYRCTFDILYIEQAIGFQKQMIKNFWDEKDGGFFLTSSEAEPLPARPKELYDGAIPSANSVSLQNLVSLFKLTGDVRWENHAKSLIESFTGSVKLQPSAFTYFLTGLDFCFGPSDEIVIVGDPDDATVQEMLSSINRTFLPKTVVLLKSQTNASKLCDIAAFTDAMKQVNDQATVYVCSNGACGQPTTDVKEMTARLGKGDSHESRR
jgi:hypothetical protein